jgi:hypothetical protein
MCTVYKNAVTNSQIRNFLFIAKSNQFMHFGEVSAQFYENHVKHVNATRVQNEECRVL